MGNIIFDCEKDCDIKDKEVYIQVLKKKPLIKDKKKLIK